MPPSPHPAVSPRRPLARRPLARRPSARRPASSRLGTLAAACSLGLSLATVWPAPPASAGPHPGRPSARPGPARPAPDGEVAVVSGTDLYLLGSRGPGLAWAGRVVRGPGAPTQPAWAPDGRWVAFLRYQPVSGAQSASYRLWVVRRDGTGARPLSPAGEDVTQFAWAPGAGADKLAYSVSGPPRYTSELFIASPSASGPGPARSAAAGLVRFGAYADLIGFSWSPSGSQLALSYRTGAPGTGPGVVAIAGVAKRGAPHVVFSVPNYGYAELASWWPSGGGLVFWDDPVGSASIAADGLTLESMDLSTRKVSALATSLVHGDFLAWSASGRQVAVVAGGNRTVWASGKRVEVCTLAAATCRPVAAPPGPFMTLGPTWLPDGRLVYVVAPGTKAASTANGGPPGVPIKGGGPYGNQTTAAWYNSQRLYATGVIAGPGAGTALAGTGTALAGVPVAGVPVAGVPVAGVPVGAHDPLSTAQGALYVRAGALWYVPLSQSTSSGGLHAGPAQRLATSLPDPNPYGNYYGYIDWAQDFAWNAND